VTPRLLGSLALALVPTPAMACAVCLDSAFGNRGFNVAFVGLMLTPFAVAAAVGAVLVGLGAGRRSSTSATEEPRC
jgi:hypothetical protein